MTHSSYPMVGVPVIRAVRYPHDIGPDADPDGDIDAVEVTQLTADHDVRVVGRVTLTAMADPDDAWGFEFDLDRADARELAKRLAEAASAAEQTDHPRGLIAEGLAQAPTKAWGDVVAELAASDNDG